MAAQCVVDSGAACPESTLDRLRPLWLPRLTDLRNDPDPKARASIGRALGMIGGDTRKGVGTVTDRHGKKLPDIDWVEIPGGEFQYGDDSEWAAPRQKVELQPFFISRYPVTTIQFKVFLDDPEGISNLKWFEGLAADDGDRQMRDPYFNYQNHPRDRVNWYQAMAFCRWLSWRNGGGYDLKKIQEWTVRLPTEFEWEKAARGTDGRIYPYQVKYSPKKANTHDTGIGKTSAVGIFPNGASPYGVMDMSGNVWEWCLSDYEKPQLDPGKEKLHTENTRVLRGGSWDDYQGNARAVFRNDFDPDFRSFSLGFRVVLSGRPPPL